MRVIEVFLQNKVPAIMVRESPEAAAPGETILWSFHSTHDNVECVQLEFENRDFYTDRGGQLSRTRWTNLHQGHGECLGTTPDLKAAGTVAAKYTVRAFGDRRTDNTLPKKLLHEDDPEIIIRKPLLGT